MFKLPSILLLVVFPLLILAQGNPLFIEVATGFTKPIVITNAGDQTNRLFIAEQPGTIKLINDSELIVNAVPFLDITNRVDDAANEEGLLGLAFHPQYKTNGFFYVNYIVNGSPDNTRISRFSVDASDPDIADPNSELVILEYDQPFNNHNGGDLQFGPDGYLYIASGDGGSGNDPQGNGQNINTLLGAILRIDVDMPFGGMNYSIPPTNPFGSEIWLYGLRNPWRFSFDASNGDMYIADVGQNVREEVNVVGAGIGGLNLGWDCREGFINSSGCTGSFHDPIFDYGHSLSTGGFSITGGFVYRGSTFSDFEGWYFFMDYVSNRLWQTKGTTVAGLQVATKIISNASSISSFGVSESGELYAVALDDGSFNPPPSSGSLFRIIDQDDCPVTLNIPTANNGDYKARDLITSDATIPINADVFYGSQEVILNPSFDVPEMTQFQTKTGICGSW